MLTFSVCENKIVITEWGGNMNFGEKIKKLRLEKEWTQDFVASKLSISVPALSRYESGTYEPKSLGIVSDFAKLYNVTTDFLLGLNVDYGDVECNAKSLPVLGIVKAGYNYLAQENIIDYIEAGSEFADAERFFALLVKGDSMSPNIDDGDYVIVQKTDGEFESGKVCVVLINGEEGTVKRVFKTDTGIELHAFNPYYPAKKYTYKEMKDLEISILGVVVRQIRNWR